jgi:hypothetical protein
MTMLKRHRAALWLLLGILLTGAAAFVYLRVATRSGSAARSLDPPVIVQQVQRLNELVSVKYTVQKVIGLEEEKFPFGSEKILLFVQAEVLAGVDLSTLSEEDVIAGPDGGIALALPPPRIITVSIDDSQTRVWDRQVTWWTPWVPFSPDLETRARLTARETIEKAALGMGILDEAGRNAETAIRALLETAGVPSVTFLSGS